MIRILKLQKAVFAFVLGAGALIAYRIMSENKAGGGNYMLTIAGIFFVAGSLMALYPILFAKKDKEGCVELDPEKQEEMITAEETAVITEAAEEREN